MAFCFRRPNPTVCLAYKHNSTLATCNMEYILIKESLKMRVTHLCDGHMTIFTINQDKGKAVLAEGIPAVLLVGCPYIAGYGSRDPGILIAVPGIGQEGSFLAEQAVGGGKTLSWWYEPAWWLPYSVFSTPPVFAWLRTCVKALGFSILCGF